jgi:NAD(P)-dependent dehydrogenase (short-subunit alcohol dehydrogenase family)
VLLAAGAAVALCGRNAERLDGAAARLRVQFPGARLFAQACDVLDGESVKAFAAAPARPRWARPPCWSTTPARAASTFADTDDQAWMDELQAQVLSIIHPTRAFLPQLAAAPAAGRRSHRLRQLAAGAPARAAHGRHLGARAGILNLVRSLATEFAPRACASTAS